jgi:hypothetical protein
LGVKSDPDIVEIAYVRMLAGLDALTQDYGSS